MKKIIFCSLLVMGSSGVFSQSAAIEFGIDYQVTKFKGHESFYDSDQNQVGMKLAVMIYLHHKTN
jgi:hypothetical protein